MMISLQRLWMGTGNGVIISVPLSESSASSGKPVVIKDILSSLNHNQLASINGPASINAGGDERDESTSQPPSSTSVYRYPLHHRFLFFSNLICKNWERINKWIATREIEWWPAASFLTAQWPKRSFRSTVTKMQSSSSLLFQVRNETRSYIFCLSSSTFSNK